jgi:hypothetical protein
MLPFSKFSGVQVFDNPRQLAFGQHVRIDFTATAGQSEWAARMHSAGNGLCGKTARQ